MDLSVTNGAKVAIVLREPSQSRVVRGTATYFREKGQLEIKLEESSDHGCNPAFIFDEAQLDIEVLPDNQFGCDYQIHIDVTGADSNVE